MRVVNIVFMGVLAVFLAACNPQKESLSLDFLKATIAGDIESVKEYAYIGKKGFERSFLERLANRWRDQADLRGGLDYINVSEIINDGYEARVRALVYYKNGEIEIAKLRIALVNEIWKVVRIDLVSR